VEGRCPACRAARAHVHHQGHGGLTPQPVIAAALILLIGLLLVTHVIW
jgi:hypothetical protein